MMNMANYVLRPRRQVAGYIKRVKSLYETKVEYGDYAINFVLGCHHGCRYCYACKDYCRFNKNASYEKWCRPLLVSNTLEVLAKEIPRYKHMIRSVHLSFTSDPFMYGYPEIAAMSLNIIAMLNSAGIRCTVLSKGVLPVELAQFSPENEYGITVTSLDQSYCDYMEPNAAPVLDRIASLKMLHDMGCKTWVSIEPFPFPGMGPDTLDQLLHEVSFVDKIIFGKVNHYKGSTLHMDYYHTKSQQVINFCRAHGIDFLIKKATPREMCLLTENSINCN